MKSLIFSDLHLYFINDKRELDNYKYLIQKIIKNFRKIDSIIISGDIWEYEFIFSNNNPFSKLRYIFENENIPIICCLGNHEFAYSKINEVLDWFKNFSEKYNIHILDIEEKYLLNNKYNFIGNVFWYDNSLGNNPFSIPDKIIANWLDSTIIDFVPSKENKKCKEQILKNVDLNKSHTNILVTHTVPHERLNWFSLNQPESLYNQYSGCKDFLKELKNTSYAICGHTHRKVFDTIYNIKCINIGNDYLRQFNEILYYLLNDEEEEIK